MISERLRVLREEQGYSKKELVGLLPFNYSTYANYESGFREPGAEVLKVIAGFYGVSVDYIVGGARKRTRADDILPVSDLEYDKIRIYRSLDEHGRRLVDFVLESEGARVKRLSLKVFNQRASAGLGNYLFDDSDVDFEMLGFVEDGVSSAADFGVRISGDSMEPRFLDGDIIGVKSVPQIDPGQVGIFIYEGEAYCKRLKVERGRGEVLLESLNADYLPIQIHQPEQLRTVGLVLGVARLS